MNVNENSFVVRLVATAGEDVAPLELPALSAAVVGWHDEDYETVEEEDDENFLIPDEEGDADEEGDDPEAEGCLTLNLILTSEAFAEYRKMRDSENDYMITATITYLDHNGVPLFHHEYDCHDGIRMIQSSGSKEEDTPMRLELQGDYHDCIQFAIIENTGTIN